MADKKEKDKDKDKAEAAPAEGEKPKGGGLPVKTIGIVAVVMIIEAVVIFFVFSAMGPKKVAADVPPAELHSNEDDQPTEILVVEDKFQNLQQGKVWIWDLSVYVQVKAKHAEEIEGKLEQRSAEIKEGISQIVGRAQPAQLKEPDRQTLNRQFIAYLTKIFGTDADGHSLIEKVVIPRCRGFPAEF